MLLDDAVDSVPVVETDKPCFLEADLTHQEQIFGQESLVLLVVLLRGCSFTVGICFYTGLAPSVVEMP
jgi:hypothetical protein